MQGTATNALTDRMIGAARLDEATFEAIEHDERATTSAMIVVALAAVAGGIGSLDDNGLLGLLGGVIGTLIGWAAFASCAYWVGTKLLAGPQTAATLEQVLRTLGFAYSPLILQVVGFVPVFGGVIAAIAGIWFLVVAVVGLRHALDVTTGRAIGIGLLALIPYLIIAGLIGALFGLDAF